MNNLSIKKLILFIILLVPLGACSSSGDDSPTVTITLTGTVTNIQQQGGGPTNSAPGITVTVTNIPKSSKPTGIDGKYSIPDIPASGDYTVEAEDPLGGGSSKVTCTIKITDSVTMQVTDGGNASGQPACTKGTGPMVLNITMS